MSEDRLVSRELRRELTEIATDLCYCSQRLDREQLREGGSPNQEDRATLHEVERDIINPLLEKGFEIVGTGVGRCVLRFPQNSSLSNYVVKLARFGDDPFSAGFIQNKREAIIWHRHGAAGQWPLLPVEDYHPVRFRWIVMTYGDQISEPPKDEVKQALRKVRSRLAMFPIHIQELRADNFVVVNGDLFMSDYGRPDGV